MFLEIDETSLLVTTDTDVTVAALEREVNESGYTLNYHPLPHKDVLLADALNERWPNLYGEVFGGLEELCVQLSLARPDGSLWQNRLTPRSATGPSLKNLAIGAQESFGVPVQAVLKLFREPTVRRLSFFVFTEERHRDLFVQAMRRQGICLPLAAEIKTVTHKRELVLGVEEMVLAGAFWGEEKQTQALQDYLQELAEAKHGRYAELPTEQNQGLWFKRLHQLAISAWHERQSQRVQEVPDAQLQLEQRVKQLG